MTPQKLKNSILQLAIAGKLVEQRAEEGTAEELFAQIQEEKQKLVAEGKLKKQKPLPEITEEEKPFDIPESWKWVRLGEVCLLNSKNDIDDDMEVSFIPMACVSDGFNNKHTYEIRKWKEIKKGFNHFANGDIGVAKITPCFQNRKSVIFKDMKNGYGAGTTELVNVRSVNDMVFNLYLLWFFKSEYFILNGMKSFTGTAGQQRIHKEYLPTCVLPLPPLAEQKRIVAKIEQLLPYLDRYEKAWSRLQEFNKRFPSDMQKSLLQYAIEGKLVEQRAEEGTAEELFAQIQAEKQRLVAEGKLKKQKPLPEITEEEKPFDIPESWKWVRLGEVTSYNQQKEKVSAQDITDEMWSLDLEDIEKESGRIIKRCYAKEREIKGDKVKFYSNQILYSKLRPYLKKILVADTEGICSSEIVPFYAYGKIEPEFMVYFLKSPFVDFTINSVTYGVKMPRVGTETMINLLFPLPPLAEQKRIVARLEELLPLCDRLKK